MGLTKEEQFNQILSMGKIKSVYQPIISLKDGEILGYEALSRIRGEDNQIQIAEMFELAGRYNKVWELEKLCRLSSLKNADTLDKGKKLFLNVDPATIHDQKFKEGFTNKKIKKYGLDPKNIIFELTERTAIEDIETFMETMNHYKRQKYQIAIDDVGAGYSGLNRICILSPEYIKIDIAIVHNIDKDAIKHSLVKNFVRFCHDSEIQLIAEGIETKEEMETLINLGVSYGQGFYIQRPSAKLVEIDKKLKEIIRGRHMKNSRYPFIPSFFGSVGTICKPKEIASPDMLGSTIYDFLKQKVGLSEVCIVDSENNVLGVLTKADLMEKFSGRFGYNIYAKKSARELVDNNFLVVDASTSVVTVSQMALARTEDQIYQSVVVTNNNKYKGMVSVKELLETAITIQINRAADANPLTGLPGNVVIEEFVKKCITSSEPYTVIYIDIDNFKAYNDAYGFNNGDLMIKALANCMNEFCKEEDFKGHIGGDDFVIVTKYWEVEELCERIILEFRNKILSLYSDKDQSSGYIISKNRNGFEDKFPIATLSISAVTNSKYSFKSIDAFSKQIAEIKKKSKQESGNAIIIE
ncbi:MAG: EAL domain-containing protein [Lachnospiraceae bacterium]|nr:EAL domain-containing protein [Lachnospiraceae bacterium]